MKTGKKLSLTKNLLQKGGSKTKRKMKKLVKLITVGMVVLSLSSCAVHSALTSNVNNHATEVVLSKKNYKIVSRVEGSAHGISVFGFGGSFHPLVAQARADMLQNAGLEGTSRAVIHETVESNYKSFVVSSVNTVTVSAYIIEFTE